MALRDRVQELLDFLKTNPPVEQVYERFYDIVFVNGVT